MKLLKLTIDQTHEIYDTFLQEDFPADEIKPWKNIERMWLLGGYSAFAAYEGETVAAYALCSYIREPRVMLLDYLAVNKDMRGRGVGSWILKELAQRIKNMGIENLLIETEALDRAKNEKQLQERLRRNHFYEKNGAILTPVVGEVYGVYYSVWQVPVDQAWSNEDCLEAYKGIYRFMMVAKAYIEYFWAQISD